MAEGIFLRIETYALHRSRRARSRRATVSDLVAEIDRAPACSRHVDDVAPPSHKSIAGPKPPKLIAGDRPRDVKRRVQREVSKIVDEQGRVPRRDQRVLAGYVVSVPVTPFEYDSDPAAKEAVDRYFALSLKFLDRHMNEMGGEIVSVALHLDESYVHMHVLALPSSVPGYRADVLHPAKSAERAARAKDEPVSVSKAEGRKAIKDFLDRFHAEVGDRFGMKRRKADESRPRVARRQIVDERRYPDELPDIPSSTKPTTSAMDATNTAGAWTLSDFVAGADTRLASLSCNLSGHFSRDSVTDELDSVSEASKGPS